MRYSEGFKASMAERTRDGRRRPVNLAAKETGNNAATIKGWIVQFKHGNLGLEGRDAITPSQRSPGEKLSLFLEGQTIVEDAKRVWLRKHGFHSEYLPDWPNIKSE